MRKPRNSLVHSFRVRCFIKHRTKEMSVGVLALQGSFHEHIVALGKLGVKAFEIQSLREFSKAGRPIWGTCAGLIFLAKKVIGQKIGGQEILGGLDCTVHRNFFGSQLNSFETQLPVPKLVAKEGGPETFRAVFIRAPAILEAGPAVEVLADYKVPSDQSATFCSTSENQANTVAGQKVIVAVKQGNILGTAFHPELTSDTRWHSFFLKMLDKSGSLNFVTSEVKQDIQISSLSSQNSCTRELGSSGAQEINVVV